MLSGYWKWLVFSLLVKLPSHSEHHDLILWVQATSWKLEEAIQLFFVGNENGLGATSGSALSLDDRSSDRTLGSVWYRVKYLICIFLPDGLILVCIFNIDFYSLLSGSKRDIVDDNVRQDDSNEVRAPIPVKREVLYDSAIHYGYVFFSLPLSV